MNITKQALIDMGCDPEHVDDWLAVRKSKGAKFLTGTAWKEILKQIGMANLTIPEGVHASAKFEWRGFRADWYAKKVGQGLGVASTVEPKTNREAVAQSLRDIHDTNW